jgi:hypothetical protein
MIRPKQLLLVPEPRAEEIELPGEVKDELAQGVALLQMQILEAEGEEDPDES